MMPATQPAASAAAQRVVIDTNSVLDWLLFHDAGVGALAAAVKTGSVQWCVSNRMRDEFARTLGYSQLARWAPDSAQLMAAFDQWSVLHPEPATCPAMRCTDPDDQVFLDLAVTCGARWLVSRDRALLRLAKQATARKRPKGAERDEKTEGATNTRLLILRPAEWQDSLRERVGAQGP